MKTLGEHRWLYATCPGCGRRKFVVNFRGDDSLCRIRAHKLRPEGVPVAELAKLAPCPGSRKPVERVLCHFL